MDADCGREVRSTDPLSPANAMRANARNLITGVYIRKITDTETGSDYRAGALLVLHEYHHLEIKLAKAGLTARARQGYYAQPSQPN